MLKYCIINAKKIIPISLATSGVFYCCDKKFDGKASSAFLRMGRAVSTVSAIVFDYKLALRKLDESSDVYRDVKSRVHSRAAVRLKELCKKNGGVYIKVGQHLSSLDYLLPREYTSCLKELLSKAPVSPIEEVFAVIEEDLNDKVENIFQEFSEEPIGAASLAQVHKAKLKNTGDLVAVKVQHKVVKQNSDIDILTMEILVTLVGKTFPEFSFMWLVEETKKNLPKELDFIHEGKNCEKVEKMFKHLKFLKVPKVYWKFSSHRILTMEYCEGNQIDDTAYAIKNQINIRKTISYLTQLYGEMIYEKGFIHCDPHPGNILIRGKGRNDVELVLLDHGLYQTLTEDFRIEYSRLWLSLMKSDIESIKKHANFLGVGHLYGLLATMEEYIRLHAGKFITEIAEVLATVPRQMLLVLKTNDLIRSIEYTHNMRSDPRNLLKVAESCTNAVYRYEKEKSSKFTYLFLSFAHSIAIMKLGFYSHLMSLSRIGLRYFHFFRRLFSSSQLALN
ncbi:DgyrCDS9844 [Dimorphilus gyrociliatus]|uniref:DgyrCDS9844 n=1 Tax=Dimorphilus gyrociliatus TaxID=2664684 RepID=A0A7I8VY94_9ANNE|nr:DgyrCDS9844 [Dimorphilus gyrociliatus]